jgi:hypothetical protein
MFIGIGLVLTQGHGGEAVASNWILAAGAWDDAGVWDDANIWID